MQTTDDAKSQGAKTHPHHHTAPHHPRAPGPKLGPKTGDLSAALENMHISTHEGKPGSAAAQTAPPAQHQHQQHQHLHPNSHSHLNAQRSAGYSPHSANRSAGPGGFSPSLNDFVAAQNGVRLLAALAAGPGGVPMAFPQPAPNAPGRQPQPQSQPAPLAFPGHPIGMPLGLPTMPLTPPAAAAYFPQLSAGHPPLYDFAALQQQHLLELAAAQHVIQSQGPGAPLSPPANLTPGISPATGQRPSPNDPNAINAAALALLQQGVVPPGFAPFPGAAFGGAPGFYPSPTDPNYNPELAAAMARALPQYTAALAAAAAAQAQYGGGVDMNTVAALNLATSANGTNGPSANNRKLGLYKTELCRSWEEKGTCRYGPKCQFAHGEEELRKVQRHPKYKTEICRTFWVSGSCPYGKRCCFIHTELPGPGAGAPGAEGATTPNGTSAPVTAITPGSNNAANAPERTPSANSSADGTEKEQSMLARISAKRDNRDEASTPTFQVNRPGLGGLRVDTSALDGAAAVKQNKSAYPTFASNQTIPTIDTRNEAPPATAGPEFGRQRLEVLGLPKGGNTHSRSLSGTDTTLGSLHQSSRSLSGAGNLTPLAAGNTPDSATAPTQVPAPASNVSHGHSRSTSGSQWRAPGAVGGGQVGAPTLGALSAFPRESTDASPWAQAATAAPTGRYPNRGWAS